METEETSNNRVSFDKEDIRHYVDDYVNARADRRISFHQGIVYRKLNEEENYYQVIISIDFIAVHI